MHEEALAFELAAYFYMEVGETEKAVQYFLLANQKYHEWGEFGKCESLFSFLVSANITTEVSEDKEPLPQRN